MNTMRGQLSPEDLSRWRRNQGLLEAMKVKPDWYTREEAERAIVEEWKLIGEFTETYHADDAKFVTFSRATGSIFESLKEYDPAEG